MTSILVLICHQTHMDVSSVPHIHLGNNEQPAKISWTQWRQSHLNLLTLYPMVLNRYPTILTKTIISLRLYPSWPLSIVFITDIISITFITVWNCNSTSHIWLWYNWLPGTTDHLSKGFHTVHLLLQAHLNLKRGCDHCYILCFPVIKLLCSKLCVMRDLFCFLLSILYC